jgi:RNA-binding protein
MRRLGKVLHLTPRGLVLRVEQLPKLGQAAYDKGGERIGRVLDLFGPVAAPYAVIRPDRGLNLTKLNELIGRDIYMGERYGKTARKAKKVPRVRKR